MVEQHTQRIAVWADLSSIRADILKDSRLKRGIRDFPKVDVDQSQLISYRHEKTHVHGLIDWLTSPRKRKTETRNFAYL